MANPELDNYVGEYCIVSAPGNFHYMIPVDRRPEWCDLLAKALMTDDLMNIPDWATYIAYLHNLRFTEYRIV